MSGWRVELDDGRLYVATNEALAMATALDALHAGGDPRVLEPGGEGWFLRPPWDAKARPGRRRTQKSPRR